MKLALAFPGQGSQYIGMCNKLMMDFSVVNQVFEEANQALDSDLRSLIKNGKLEELTLSEHAQPAVVTASYALYRVFEEQTGLTPFCAVGHSLGEISALIAAGAMSFSDGVRFARKRGEIMHRAMQEKKGRAGIVVDLEEAALMSMINTICLDDYVAITGYNSPNQFIVAGHQTALQRLDKEVATEGGELIPFRMMPMKADAPYHSQLMTYLQPDIKQTLQKIDFNHTKFDVWSTVTGRIIEPTDHIADILGDQLVQPVYWNQALSKINAQEVELIIDMGPQQITRNLVRENKTLPTCLAFDDEGDRELIFDHIGKGA
ncbi:ACP S-malonyltransferase [Bacillus horti]|uniref:Malonyl CoA-acyl carrier protein transacylase n=1 Tax=Caldalkalibacillus horti TaxID=77523 RepID=A0ABT9VV38_9BACI|nr:ACP S-malonyltransferase [Bacillus horti]MDQ0164749.1 [acyl-carrier-protein] S-malonyltransferase [Bacillus horti]